MIADRVGPCMAHGRTRTLAGLSAYLQAYEARYSVRFASWLDKPTGSTAIDNEVNSKRRLCWETASGVDSTCVVPFDGVPYLNMESHKFRCRRSHCPAALLLKVVLKLPDVALAPGQTSENARRECALRLREKLRTGDMTAHRWFYFRCELHEMGLFPQGCSHGDDSVTAFRAAQSTEATPCQTDQIRKSVMVAQHLVQETLHWASLSLWVLEERSFVVSG